MTGPLAASLDEGGSLDEDGSAGDRDDEDGNAGDRDDEEVLPFDVEIERLPTWVHVASGLVVVTGILVAARLVPMTALLPFLIASSVGRRFASSALHVEVRRTEVLLGERAVARSKVLDVSTDLEGAEARVALAFATGNDEVELAVLHFESREQARRFEAAFADDPRPAVVVGHRPRAIEALSSLRFVALAAAFFATGSRYGLFALVFFAFGAWAFARARQVVVRPDAFEVNTPFGKRSFSHASVARCETESGSVFLDDGQHIDLPKASFRDATLASPAWLDRARGRALDAIGARSASARSAHPDR